MPIGRFESQEICQLPSWDARPKPLIQLRFPKSAMPHALADSEDSEFRERRGRDLGQKLGCSSRRTEEMLSACRWGKAGDGALEPIQRDSRVIALAPCLVDVAID